MFNLLELKDFKLDRMKVALPKSETRTHNGNLIIMNTKNKESMSTFINNTLINKMSVYSHIYMDSKYSIKAHGKILNKNLMKIRLDDYKYYKELGLDGIINLKTNKDRNLYYDISKHNELFFSITEDLNYKTKYESYIDLLKNILNNDEMKIFPIRIMIIQLSDWTVDKVDSTNTQFNNPVNLLYTAMKKNINKLKELGDIDIFMVDNTSVFRFNPERCDEKSFGLFKREISKIKHSALIDENTEAKAVEDENVDITEPVGDDIQSSVDIKPKEKALDALKQEFGDEVDNEEVIDEMDKMGKRVGSEDVDVTDIINDAEVVSAIAKNIKLPMDVKSTAMSKRDEELRLKQQKIKLSGVKTLEDLRVMKASDIKIPHNDISNKVNTTNPNAKVVKFPHFEKVYNEHVYEKDISSIVTFLNNKSIPVYVRDVKIEDKSDSLNLKKTYTFNLEDNRRTRHTLKVDLPIFVDDKFCFLNGNKKIFDKQLFLKPLVKTGPDTVQVCTNYNKIFMVRYGENVEDKFERFKAWVRTDSKSFSYRKGNNSQINKSYKTTIEYDTLAKTFSEIKVKNEKGVVITLVFNQDNLKNMFKEYKMEDRYDRIKDNELCVGFENINGKQEPILVDVDTQTLVSNLLITDKTIEDEDLDNAGIVDYVLSVKQATVDLTEFNNFRVGKKFMYTRCTIMKKKIPLIILLAYNEGLSTVLRKAGINHSFTDTRPRFEGIEKTNKGVIQFGNGYLIYDKYPLENSLLLNGLTVFPVKNYDYEEFDDKNIYLDIFDTLYGSRILANALDNFYEFMLDPVSVEVLNDMHYPTEFVPLMILGNKLLADNNYREETDMNIYRVRSNEMVYAYMYKAVTDAYIKYKLTSENKNPIKISIPQDVVTKNILMSEIVEDYSELSPIVELEKSRAITSKG